MLQDAGTVEIVPMAIGHLLPARHHKAGGVQVIPVPIVPEPAVLQNTGLVKIVPVAVRQPLPAGNMASIFIIEPLAVFLIPTVTNWSCSIEMDGDLIQNFAAIFGKFQFIPGFFRTAKVNVFQVFAPSEGGQRNIRHTGRNCNGGQIIHSGKRKGIESCCSLRHLKHTAGVFSGRIADQCFTKARKVSIKDAVDRITGIVAILGHKTLQIRQIKALRRRNQRVSTGVPDNQFLKIRVIKALVGDPGSKPVRNR